MLLRPLFDVSAAKIRKFVLPNTLPPLINKLFTFSFHFRFLYEFNSFGHVAVCGGPTLAAPPRAIADRDSGALAAALR